MWDAATLQPIDPLPLGVDGPWFITSNADGSKMISGSTNGTAVGWSVDVGDWENTAWRIAGRNLTRAEGDRDLPGRPYRTTCTQWPAGT